MKDVGDGAACKLAAVRAGGAEQVLTNAKPVLLEASVNLGGLCSHVHTGYMQGMPNAEVV